MNTILITGDDFTKIKECSEYVIGTLEDELANKTAEVFIWNTLDDGSVLDGVSFYSDKGSLIVLDQTARVFPGWLDSLTEEPSKVYVGDREHDGLTRSIAVVSACTSDTLIREQVIAADYSRSLGEITAQRAELFKGSVSIINRLDGLCLLLKEPVLKLIRAMEPCPDSILWDEVALLCDGSGLPMALSEGAYVPRSEEAQAVSLVDRLKFYTNHPVKTPKINAAIVVNLVQPADIQSLATCLASLSRTVDGVAMVVAGDPSQWPTDGMPKQLARLPELCRRKPSTVSFNHVGDALEAWASEILTHASGGNAHRRVGLMSVKAQSYLGPQKLSSMRNAALQLTHTQLAGDSVLAMNHNESLHPEVTHAKLSRVLQHPNPQVRAFDLGLLVHKVTPHFFGPDETSNSLTLYRKSNRDTMSGVAHDDDLVPFCDDGVSRVSRFEVRSFAALIQPPTSDRVTLAPLHTLDSLGLHMLLWEKEDPADVERWLDQTHAMVEHVALVWTGDWEEADKDWLTDPSQIGSRVRLTGPSATLAVVGELYGVEWIHQPLNDNIAEARNAGIKACYKAGCKWTLFFDPDEWLQDPNKNLVQMRNNMQMDRLGFLCNVANWRQGSDIPTVSESIRLMRSFGGKMLMSGRVHESFSRAISHSQDNDGLTPKLAYLPFLLQHRGLNGTPEQMADKLKKYDRLLRMQISDDPHDPGAWTSLGWNYLNEGLTEQGEECFSRAIKCATGGAFLPFKEMGFLRMRQAREAFLTADSKLASGHTFKGLCGEILEQLNKYSPPHSVIEHDGEILGSRELPEWTPPTHKGSLEP